MPYNSTIIRKKCKCKECQDNPDKAKWPTLSCFGYNYNCLPLHLKNKAGTKKKVQQKNHNKRVAMGRQLHRDQKAADEHTWQLELFFSVAAIELSKNPFCQECNGFISEKYYRTSTAHILAKRKEYSFQSVATHPKNRLFLCGINGCHDRTHRWDTFSKMKVWPLAVEAFKEIYPFIAVWELKNIPNVLLKTLVNEEQQCSTNHSSTMEHFTEIQTINK